MEHVFPQVSLKRSLPGQGWPRRAFRLVTLLQCLPLLLGIVLMPVAHATPPATSPAVASADSPRFSAERLQRLDGFLHKATDAQGYLGAVSLVMQDGAVVHSQAYGYRDLARSLPMQQDSIFRIYSMTKTVTTIAVLMLVEEGKLSLDDPVEKILPEFAGMQIFTGGTADAPVLLPARSSPTIRQLLTHTAGFATAGGEEATKLLERADLHGSADHAEFSRRLAKVPLAVEPGTRFRYDGTQIEVVARIVELVSGQRFDVFVQQRILDPLRMHDTGFSVPLEKRERIVDITVMGADGKLVLDAGRSAVHPGEMLNPYPGGAGGLYSTAPDFMRLCQMLLNGGVLEGVSLLDRKTVEQLMVNQLTFLDPPVTQFSDAEGFGLGGSVLLDPAGKGRLGAAGQFGWSGAASTYFSIDPKEHLVSILLLQHLPNDAPNDLPRLSTRFYNYIQEALLP